MGAGTRCGTLGMVSYLILMGTARGERLLITVGNQGWRDWETSGVQDKVGSCVRALTLEHAFDSGFL